MTSNLSGYLKTRWSRLADANSIMTRASVGMATLPRVTSHAVCRANIRTGEAMRTASLAALRASSGLACNSLH